MRTWRCAPASMAVALLFIGAPSASAQDSPQALRQEIDQLRRVFDALKQQYGERLSALESKLATAEGAAPTPTPAATPPAAAQPVAEVPAGAAGAGGPSGALPVYGAAVSGAKVFNP